MRPIIGFFLSLFLIFSPVSAWAEEPVNPAPPPHPGQDRPPLPDYLTSPSDDGVTTPPAPERRDARPEGGSIQLKGLEIDGATVFSDAELTAVAEPFISKTLPTSCVRNFIRLSWFQESVEPLAPGESPDVFWGLGFGMVAVVFVVREY